MTNDLRDAHLHLDQHGEELSCLNLSACGSREQCLEELSFVARDLAPGEWVVANGVRIEGWGGDSWPTAGEVADAVGGRPAVVRSFDHHALVASEAALKAAGIDGGTADPAGGIIERDATGAPTGLLLEKACKLVYGVMPPASDERYRGWIVAALEDLSNRGFCEVHDMLSTRRMARVLLDLEREGRLALSVRLYALEEEFLPLSELALQWESERVRLGGLKIFTDGTLNSRTAHMLTPYADPLPNHPMGTPLMTPGEIERAVRLADERGYPVAAHAIGDGAVRAVLDAIERARPSTFGQRIEHAEFVDEADIGRFADMGVIASLQPCHLLTDIEAIERLMPHRAERSFPLRDLVESAAAAGFEPEELVWLGSDAPIVPPEPGDNIQAAVERRRRGEPESRMIGSGQAITRERALALLRSPERR